MIKEGKFGPQEAISLITITIVTRVFFTSPSVITRIVGTAGWFMTLISATTAMASFTITYLLLKRWPDKNLIEIYEISLGKYIGFFFSATLSISFIIDSGGVLREFSEVMKVYVLPLSPPSYIMGLFLFGVIVMSTLGLETQARFARLVAPTLLIGMIIVLLLANQNYQVHRIQPIFGYGLKTVVFHGILRNSVYGYTIIAAIIAGSLQGIKHIKKIGYTSIILSGVLISVSLLCFTLTFPYFVAQEVTSPLYQMVSLIDYGRFFQRLDSLFLFVWNISTLIAVTIEVYISASIYCKMFKIDNIRPVIIPISVIVFTVALTPEDLETVALGHINVMRGYSWIGVYIPVIIAFIVTIIKGLKKGNTIRGNAKEGKGKRRG